MQFLVEPCDLLVEWFAVALYILGSDVATRRQDIPVVRNFLSCDRCAEARDVCVRLHSALAAPGVVGASDTCDVLIGKLAMHPAHHSSELACVDKECLTSPVTPSAGTAG